MKDRLIELIQNSVNGCARHWAEIIADYLIKNDVVPVVSCRECKHCGNFKDYNNKTIFKVCLLGGGLTAVPDNHYCGYGERK